MTSDKDNKGHVFVKIENVRVTYIPASDRVESKNWAGCDVIRFQSYKNEEADNALHMGAEIPVQSPEAFGQLIAAMCQTYGEGREILSACC